MLEILLPIGIGVVFFHLATRHHKNPLLWAGIGITAYLIPVIVWKTMWNFVLREEWFTLWQALADCLGDPRALQALMALNLTGSLLGIAAAVWMYRRMVSFRF